GADRAGACGTSGLRVQFRTDVVPVSRMPGCRCRRHTTARHDACREGKTRRTIDSMSTRARRAFPAGLLFLLTLAPARAQTPPRQTAPGFETLVRAGGQRVAGKLRGDAARGFIFVPAAAAAAPSQVLSLEPGAAVIFDGPDPDPAAGLLPFRVEMGLGQRVS